MAEQSNRDVNTQPVVHGTGHQMNTVPSLSCAVGGAAEDKAGGRGRRQLPQTPTSPGRDGGDGQCPPRPLHGPRTPGPPDGPPRTPGDGRPPDGPRTPGDGRGDGNITYPPSVPGAARDSNERMQFEVQRSKGGHSSSSPPGVVESSQPIPEKVAWERLIFSISYTLASGPRSVTFDASSLLDVCKLQFAMTKRSNFTMDTLQDKSIYLKRTSSSIEFNLSNVQSGISEEALKKDLIDILKDDIIEDLDIKEIGMDTVSAQYVFNNLQKTLPSAMKNNKAEVYYCSSKRMICIVGERSHFEKVLKQLTAGTESADEGTKAISKSDFNLSTEDCVLLEDLNFCQFVKQKCQSTSLKVDLGYGPEFMSGTDSDLQHGKESWKDFTDNIVHEDCAPDPWKFQFLFEENGEKNESVHLFLKNWVIDELALEKKRQLEVLFHLQKVRDVTVQISCLNKEVLEKVKHVLDSMERFQGLAPDDELKWFDTCRALNKVHVITRTDKVIKLLCRKDVLREQELKLPGMIIDFLKNHGKDCIDKAEKKFVVKLLFSSDAPTVTVKGDQKSYEEVKQFLKKEIKDMRTSIQLDLTEEAVRMEQVEIANAASRNKCCWQVQPVTRQTSDSKLANCEYLATWFDPLGALKIHVVRAHPGKLALDLLILLVNDSLYPLHDVDLLGLAGQEFLQAGHEFYTHRKPSDAVNLGKTMFNDTPGNLKCSNTGAIVICSKQTFIDQQVFVSSFKHILDQADGRNFKKIGVAAGLQKGVLSAADWHKVLVKGSIDYFSNNKQSKIQEIFICCDQSSEVKVVKEVNKQVDTYFQRGCARKIFVNGILAHNVPKIKVRVQEGVLHEMKSHILVNTTNRTLKLAEGQVSKKLSQAAGPGLQEECLTGYPKGIGEREVAVTKSHILLHIGVKKIIHGVLPDFIKNACRDDVKYFVKTCLYAAEKLDIKGYRIAFPAIGVGKMEYPRRDVAEAMFIAVDEFRQEAVNAQLREVKFVVYDQDVETCEVFHCEEWRWSSNLVNDLGREYMHGHIPNCRSFQKRSNQTDRVSQIKVALHSEIDQLPSHAVEVTFSMSSHSKELKRAMEPVKSWNDQLRIPIRRSAPEKQALAESMKAAIEWCMDKERRITEVAFGICHDLHLSEVEQVALMADCLLQEKNMRFLQTVYIGMSDDQSLTKAAIHLKAGEGKTDRNKWEWSSGEERIEDYVTIELVGQTKELLEKAKSDILDIVQKIKKASQHQQQLDKQQHQQQKSAKSSNDKGARPKTGNKNASRGIMQTITGSHGGTSQGAEKPLLPERKRVQGAQREETIQPSKQKEPDVVIQRGGKDADTASHVSVKAEISPAIIKEKGVEKDSWLQKIKSAFSLEILPVNGTTCVRGSLQKILEFEKYLDEDFPDDPVINPPHSGAAMANSGGSAGDNSLSTEIDYSHFSDEFCIEMDEVEYLAMQRYLVSIKMAEKVRQMKYDNTKGMVILGDDNKFNISIKQAYLKIRQEKRQIILNEMNECLLASNVCESVHNANPRVFCHYIPEKNTIVIFAPDGEDVAAAEHKVCVELGREPVTSEGEGEEGQSGAGQVPSSHPLSGMSYPPDMKEYQRGGLTVKVYKGSIIKLRVACIIVSNQPYLTNRSGVAEIVGKAAGRDFQEECNRIAQACKGLKDGQNVMTSAGALTHYKRIVHVYLPVNQYGQEQRQLNKFEQSIVDCLEKVDGEGLASVALPCVGTGLNGFSIEKCAQQYFRAIDKFSKSAQSVSEVHFVDVNEENIKQVNATFDKHFRPQKKDGSLSQSMHPSKISMAAKRTVTEKGKADLSISVRTLEHQGMKTCASHEMHGTKPGKSEPGGTQYIFYTPKGVQIIVTQGDITSDDVDGIVSIEDKGFTGTGAISSAILRKGTDTYRASHHSLKTNFPKRSTKVGDVVYTFADSDQLKCEYVFHAVAPHWSKDYVQKAGALEKDIRSTMDNILSRANEVKVKSLAVPLLGASDSKAVDTPLDTCCRAIVSSVIQFLQEVKVPILGEIHFVSPDIAAVHQLREEVKNQLEAEDEAGAQASPKVKGFDRFKKDVATAAKDVFLNMAEHGQPFY